MGDTKPENLKHLQGKVTTEAVNALIDVINVLSWRVYELERSNLDLRRSHEKDDRQTKPL